jgi:hydroxyacylglutathione hydrolase
LRPADPRANHYIVLWNDVAFVLRSTKGVMMGLVVMPLVDEGLGNSAYLLDLGDGRALAVDASRDLRALRATAERRRLRVAYAADTHLHADFLTGGLQLAATDGATVLASAAGRRDFPHRGLGDGDEVDLGGLTLRTLATPGHTHEHIAYELLDGSRVLGVFTGGSLLVGSAARTDLVSPEATEQLARAQYRSLQRLAELDDDVAVWPTHGAGSFCSARPGAERTSTIGIERATNALLRAGSEDVFVKELLDSLGTFPAYFLRLGEINRRGPALVADDALASLSAEQVAGLRTVGAEVVDVRPPADFAGGHLPGAVSIPLRPAFATWLGWLIAPDKPFVVVRNPDQDPGEIVWQARKIGYDLIAGELDGGLDASAAAGKSAAAIPIVDASGIAGAQVLDIRQDDEYAQGHLPGAIHLELGSLMRRLADLPPGPTVVMCGHGERAMGAASLLQRAGRGDLAVFDGGPDDWSAATGQTLESSR